MAQTIVQGLRDVTSAQSLLIPPQVVQNQIDLLTINKAPWSAVIRAANKKDPVGNWSFLITQDLLVKNSTTLASTAAVAATSWVLASGTGAYVAGWDILWNRTRNVFVIVQSMSTDTATVVANIDSGTDVQGEVGDEIVILTNSTQESGGVVQAKTTTVTQRTNYVTDIMTSWDFSDMAQFSDSFFDKKDFDYQQMKIMIEHQRKLQNALLLGPKATLLTPSGTYENPTRQGSYRAGLTMSFRAFMDAYADTDHVKTRGALSLFEFLDDLPAVFYAEDEGQNKKKATLWCTRELLTGMEKWFIGQARFENATSVKDLTAGLGFVKWHSSHGDINMIVVDDLRSRVSGGTHFYFFTDNERLGYVPYRNLDTHIEENAVKDGRKRTVGYIRTVIGSHYTQENAHFKGAFSSISA